MSVYNRIHFPEAATRAFIDSLVAKVEVDASSVFTVNTDEEVILRVFDNCYPTENQLVLVIDSLEYMRKQLYSRGQVCHQE